MRKIFESLLMYLAFGAVLLFALVLRLIYTTAYIFDIPYQLYLKNADPEKIKERERAEYYHRYL